MRPGMEGAWPFSTQLPTGGPRIPGLTHNFLGGDLLGRHTGMAGGVRPTFRTKEINAWLEHQFKQANLDREVITKQLRDERRGKRRATKSKKVKKSRGKRRRSPSTTSSSSSSGSSQSALNALGSDEHDFRRLAREHPGVTFASVVADTRVQLGQKGFDHDVGATGPVFWKWWESVLPQKTSAAALSAVKAQGELLMLVTALDEFRQGRFLEVGDILASRARALAYYAEGADKGNKRWRIGREFLTDMEEPHSLKSNEMAQCTFEPQQPLVADSFKNCEGLSRVAFMDGNGVVMLGKVVSVEAKVLEAKKK